MTPSADPDFQRLLEFISNERGFDFTQYRSSTVMRRTKSRMDSLGVDSFSDYLDRLQADSGEFEALFNTILINVTSFFRDPEAWDYLSRTVIPRLIQAHAPGEHIRVWSAGCASGEEPYTIAMAFAEQMGIEAAAERLKIYATDIDEDALQAGRQASYRAADLEELPSNCRTKYFVQSDGSYYFHPELRRVVIFGRQDLLVDAPISKLDLLTCRNALMYFNPESQERVLRRFFFALKPGGYLFLGKAETMLTGHAEVEAVDAKFRIFRKTGSTSLYSEALSLGRRAQVADSDDPLDPTGLVSSVVFDVNPVAELVVDMQGRLALANHRARELFELTATELGKPLQDLQISYRPLELRSLIERVRTDGQQIFVDDVVHRQRAQEISEDRWFSVCILPLVDGTQMLGVKVIFSDETELKAVERELAKTRSDLETAYEELQSSNEELETTNEELQSSVEELETTNEELQSSNEELETMNEELRSTNEELESLNDALRERTNAMNDTKQFLESIVGSIQSGVIVVDRELKVEVWNQQAEEQWGLRSSEARGHYLPNLDFGLPVDRLFQAIRETADNNGHEVRHLTLNAVNRLGRTVECSISLTPRLRESGEIAGTIVVIDTHETNER